MKDGIVFAWVENFIFELRNSISKFFVPRLSWNTSNTSSFSFSFINVRKKSISSLLHQSYEFLISCLNSIKFMYSTYTKIRIYILFKYYRTVFMYNLNSLLIRMLSDEGMYRKTGRRFGQVCVSYFQKLGLRLCSAMVGRQRKYSVQNDGENHWSGRRPNGPNCCRTPKMQVSSKS